jgi:RNA polymerase sigma-70 factor, ECF subfamily
MNTERQQQAVLTKPASASVSPMEAFLVSVEKRAYKSALLSTKRSADALDIVQDAMLQLVQKYSEKTAAEWPLVFQRILQNKIVDWHRSQSKAKRWFWQAPLEDENETEDWIAQIEGPEKNPLEILEKAKDMEIISKIVESLPIRQRQAFLLRAWEGFDTRATAVAMGCSEGSVKTHYFRALESMRAALTNTN